MTRRIIGLLAAASLVTGIGTGRALAQQTQPAESDPLTDPQCQRRFESQFGAEAVKVDMSPTKSDDAVMAARLVAAARNLTDPAYEAYVLDKAVIFGLRNPAKPETVAAALARLDVIAPMHRRKWDTHRLKIRREQQHLARGALKLVASERLVDQLLVVAGLKVEQGKWDEATELYRQAVQFSLPLKSPQKDYAAERYAYAGKVKEVLALRDRLSRSPDDARLRKSVIDAYLGLLDDPAGARDLLTPAVSEAYRTYVPMAIAEPDDLASGPLLELGNWYKSMIRKAPAAQRPTLLGRATEYYLAHLRAIRRDGRTVAAVQAAREKIDASLAAAGAGKLPGEVLFRDPAVQKSFRRAESWLWRRQASDGGWIVRTTYSARDHGAYNVHSTALVLSALLAGGARVDDPGAARAVRWLEPTTTSQTEGVALRCLAWVEIHKQRPGKARNMLASDLSVLMRATRTGGYPETVTSGYSIRPANSWQPLVGVDAGEQCGLKARRQYWQMTAKYWSDLQQPNGSFVFRSRSRSSRTDRGRDRELSDIERDRKIERERELERQSKVSPTILGAGCLAICLNRIFGEQELRKLEGPRVESIHRAIVWLKDNFKTMADLRARSSVTGRPREYGDSNTEHILLSNSLYMLSRLGLILGREKIGDVDWWTGGGRYVAALQREDGSWGNIYDTAMVLHFMLNGHQFEQEFQKDQPARMTAEEMRRAAGMVAKPAEPVDPPDRPSSYDPQRDLRYRESRLRSRLSGRPGDQKAARELVRLYVVEMKTPEKALAYAAMTGDSRVARYVKLLSIPARRLYEDELLGMGDWMMALAGGASDTGRKYALGQAATYYKTYLAREPGFATEIRRARRRQVEAVEALEALKDK